MNNFLHIAVYAIQCSGAKSFLKSPDSQYEAEVGGNDASSAVTDVVRVQEVPDTSSIASWLAPVTTNLCFLFATAEASSVIYCKDVKSTCCRVLRGSGFDAFCSFQDMELDVVG